MTKTRLYPPPMADIRELAYQIGLSETTIRLYVKNGWLPPPHTVGNKKIWIVADVMAHIAGASAQLPANAGAPHRENDEYNEALQNVAAREKAHA